MRHTIPATLAISAVLICAGLRGGQAGTETAIRLEITGDVAAPLTLRAADLSAMPRIAATLDEHGKGRTAYQGVPLIEILRKAGVASGHDLRGQALSTYVLATARDGYQVVFSLAELNPGLGASRALVADRREGNPLPEPQGPLRLVVTTDQRPARSVRMLEKIEIVQLRK